MRLPIVLMSIWIVINSGIGYWIFNILRRRHPKCKVMQYAWLLLVVASAILGIVTVSLPVRTGDEDQLHLVNWLLFITLSFTIPQYVYLIFDLLGRLPKLFHKNRCKWSSRTGIAAAYILFAGMWWGALVNRFNIDVKEITIEIPGLPAAFDGYRIVQFSDLHTGTFGNDTQFVEKIVSTINDEKPDIVFFTGDIVNRRSRELRPFTRTLNKLKAPDGVVAILGNHDYGDYYNWFSQSTKMINMEELTDMYRQDIGWRLLRNKSFWLHHGNDSIAILGVENIGDKPFPIYGSLKKTYKDLGDEHTKILLSHNPAHWVDSIQNHEDVNIALTLSGHTHAMQMEIAGISPARFRYPKWGGLYKDDKGQQLYVNIGCGTVGFPMRLGATPEITVITLRPQESSK